MIRLILTFFSVLVQSFKRPGGLAFLKNRNGRTLKCLLWLSVFSFQKEPPLIFVIIIYIELCDEAEIKNRIKLVLK